MGFLDCRVAKDVHLGSNEVMQLKPLEIIKEMGKTKAFHSL